VTGHADVDVERVRDALRTVIDPEAGVNIVDLGLVYGIEVMPDAVEVLLTMTSAACPMAEMVLDDVRAALERLLPPQVWVEVVLVWDPPWTPERMSAAARRQFGWEPSE
jgi:metal-sulfur cluster biosynthetic enzyme